jgi:hypothetical protein
VGRDSSLRRIWTCHLWLDLSGAIPIFLHLDLKSNVAASSIIIYRASTSLTSIALIAATSAAVARAYILS